MRCWSNRFGDASHPSRTECSAPLRYGQTPRVRFTSSSTPTAFGRSAGAVHRSRPGPVLWSGADSNRRHTAFQAVALPPELPDRERRACDADGAPKQTQRLKHWIVGKTFRMPVEDSRTSNDGEGSPACPPPMSSGVDSEKSNIPRGRKPGSRGRPFNIRR